MMDAGVVQAIFRKWERLRPFYNAVLVVTVAALWWAGRLPRELPPGLPVLLLVRAVMANVCFTAGPAVEAYAGWLGWRPRWLRPLLFVLGTLFATTLAVLSLGACG